MGKFYNWVLGIIGIFTIIGSIVYIFLVTANKNDIRNTDNYEVVEFTHKNHDYIFVKIGMGKSGTGGLVHDPDCKFCNNNK